MEPKFSAEELEISLTMWLYRYRMQLLALLFLILAIGLGLAWQQLHESAIQNEIQLKMLQAGSTQAQLDVARQYLDEKSVALYLLLIAEQQNDNKDFAGAKKTYELFIQHYPHHLFSNAAHLGLATDLELLDQPDAALAEYLHTGRAKPYDSYTPLALLRAAEIYDTKKEIKNERQVLGDCSNQFRETIYGKQASEKLKTLSESAS